MTNAAIARRHPEATEWAAQFFNSLKRNRDPVIGVRWLDTDGNRRAIIDLFKYLAARDPLRMLVTIAEAEAGWDLAHEALKELAIEMSKARQQLPLSLDAYRDKILAGFSPKIRSTQKGNHWLRNMAIAYAVDALHTKYSIGPTGKKSGSAIVAAALRGNPNGVILTARQVANVWREYNPWLRRMPSFSAHLQSLTM